MLDAVQNQDLILGGNRGVFFLPIREGSVPEAFGGTRDEHIGG